MTLREEFFEIASKYRLESEKRPGAAYQEFVDWLEQKLCAAEAEAIERCAQKMCIYCGGDPEDSMYDTIPIQVCVGVWVHRFRNENLQEGKLGSTGTYEAPCSASGIRSLRPDKWLERERLKARLEQHRLECMICHLILTAPIPDTCFNHWPKRCEKAEELQAGVTALGPKEAGDGIK